VVRRRLLIDLPVRNEWSNIELVRTAILNCFAAVFNEMDSCRAVATVISELLENAIKYGDWSHPELDSLRLEIEGNTDAVTVSVEHPVDPRSASLVTLMDTLRWLSAFQSPAEAYRARLSEFAEKPPEAGISRLGLARIAYEGNCTLRAEVKDASLRIYGQIIN
jgi:hypothetical protein